jgi:transketolase
MATGAEVHLALAGVHLLHAEGVKARLVSLPSWEIFEAQPAAYRAQVLPPTVRARVAVEAAASFGWHRWVGDQGEIIAIDRFGASAPGDRLFREFGFTPEHIVAAVKRVLGRAEG